MSGTNSEDAKEIKLDDDPPTSDKEKENSHPCSEQEDETIKKYGGLLRKKRPLISKDHDRTFFDSADWALGKQGAQKSKGPLEALRPKLQPTPHQSVRSRRSAYAPSDDSEGAGHEECTPSDKQGKAPDGCTDSDDDHPEDVPKRDDHPEDVPKRDDHPEDKNS